MGPYFAATNPSPFFINFRGGESVFALTTAAEPVSSPIQLLRSGILYGSATMANPISR